MSTSMFDLSNPFADTNEVAGLPDASASIEAQIDNLDNFGSDGSTFANNGNVAPAPTVVGSNPNSVGGILNGLGGLFTDISRVVASGNVNTGAVPRTLYRPASATALGVAGGSSLALFALVGIGLFLYLKKK